MGSVVYGGLDVHKESISACLINRETGAIVQDQVPNDPAQLLRAVRRWQKLGELRLCYEASGAGYVIKRWLDGEGIACEVIAPSKIPHAPGERIKTDRRDARKLAQLYAAGLLSPVRTPSQAEEQVRAIVRLRDEITRDMTRIKNRIVKHLGRLHIRFEGGRNWTQKHRRWLQKLGLDPAEALILNIHLNTLDHLESQRQELDQKIAVIAEEPTYRESPTPPVLAWDPTLQRDGVAYRDRRYCTLRQCAPTDELLRVGTARGQQRRHPSSGGITKTGNSRGRWILGQAAWNQSRRPGSGRLRKHWRTQAPELVAIARRAEKRLHQKFWRIAARKERTIAATAVARELAGFVWAILSVPCTQTSGH